MLSVATVDPGELSSAAIDIVCGTSTAGTKSPTANWDGGLNPRVPWLPKDLWLVKGFLSVT